MEHYGILSNGRKKIENQRLSWLDLVIPEPFLQQKSQNKAVRISRKVGNKGEWTVQQHKQRSYFKQQSRVAWLEKFAI